MAELKLASGIPWHCFYAPVSPEEEARFAGLTAHASRKVTPKVSLEPVGVIARARCCRPAYRTADGNPLATGGHTLIAPALN